MVVVPQATKDQPHARPYLRRIPVLNTDGERHPLETALTAFTLAAGVAAFATGWVVSQHLLASWLGAAALAIGLYAQLISATRQERMLIVTGLVAAFVGLALGLAHGGFHP
ncbi:MAG TPA: hypothetical protein VE343_15825 [Streptosporangiaceae bacterium]|nr:hypothetical protein [Streptosporangiaceae bacterium]